MLEIENQDRIERSRKTLLKLSRLPFRKSLGGFDFYRVTGVSKREIEDFMNLSFIEENQNFLGPSGIGKTHLTMSIALEAIQNGLKTYFMTAQEHVTTLETSDKQGKLEKK